MRRLAFILLFLALGLAPARAQFNGWNGIYALNHMSFGVMDTPAPAVVSGGSGYTNGDVLTLDCLPDIYVVGVRPTVTVTGVNGSGAVTSISLTTVGFATKLPSTGLAGEPNGVCTFNTTGGSGTGATIYGVYGFLAANGSGGGGGGLFPIPPDNTLVNITNADAIPQAVPLPPCDTVNQALTYTLGTGFGCNTISAASSLEITDGTTTVSNITQIAFIGAVVSGTTPNGIVTISAGGGTNLHASSTSLTTSLVVKASDALLFGFYCNAITGGISGVCIAYNNATAPSPGALTAAKVLDTCTITSVAGCFLSRIPSGVDYSAGVVILLSSAATPFTYTTGTLTGFLSADYQ